MLFSDVQTNAHIFAHTIYQTIIHMKYQKKCSRGMTWLTLALSCISLLSSCGKQENSRFVFHLSEEAVAACHKELATLREIKTADISKLTTVVADWVVLQDSVYNCLSRDTAIQLNTHLTTDYYTVSDSIREELVRIAKLQPRSLHDVTYLKIHTAQGREKIHDSQDFKKACEIFSDMEKSGLYSDLAATLTAYNNLLDTTDVFSKENEVVAFLEEEDRCFRSLMNFLSEAGQNDLALITGKTARLFDDLYGRVSAGGNSTVSERMSLFLTMRFNRRIIQNAEACMKDIHGKKRLSDQQKDSYRWMLIQPFMSIDSYSMASLTDRQEKALLHLADELPTLFACLDNTPNSDKELQKLNEVLSDFFLSSYLKSSL